MEEEKFYGEHCIIRCNTQEQNNEVANYYKTHYGRIKVNFDYLPYVIYRGEGKIGNMLFYYVPTECKYLPIYTFQEWKEIITNKQTKQTKEMKQYRIKTNDELVKEFGKNWRKRVTTPWNYDGKMDYLIGYHFTIQENSNYTTGDKFYTEGWAISPDCITEVDNNNFTNKFGKSAEVVNIPTPKVTKVKPLFKKKDWVIVLDTQNVRRFTKKAIGHIFQIREENAYYDWFIKGNASAIDPKNTYAVNYELGDIRLATKAEIYAFLNKEPEFKVDDFVMLTKSSINWDPEMKHNIVVKVTKVDTNANYFREKTTKIYFEGSEGWSYLYCCGHFRMATPAEIKAFSKPTRMQFGSSYMEVNKYKGIVDCENGTFTKSEVENAIGYINTIATTPTRASILGYNMHILITDATEIKFGCMKGTIGQAKAILKELNG